MQSGYLAETLGRYTYSTRKTVLFKESIGPFLMIIEVHWGEIIEDVVILEAIVDLVDHAAIKIETKGEKTYGEIKAKRLDYQRGKIGSTKVGISKRMPPLFQKSIPGPD
ncbi:MAG: hypothetical protein JNM39_10130 [Bdellovibrionaceae bacterium]|nr:hypothetical protein [Pseudobdellovibrionaceae bacterium]